MKKQTIPSKTKELPGLETKRFPTVKKLVKLNEIFPNPWNPNSQSKEMFEKEIQSIEKFGFIAPILVRTLKDNTYQIIDGEHRWRACLQMSFEEMPVEDIGTLDEGLAKVLTINLNNLRGQDDVLKRAEILKTLSTGQLSLLPFDVKQMENEIKLLDFDFAQFENAEVPTEEKLKIPIEKMKQIGQILQQIYSKTRNTALRVAIENYKEVLKIFESLTGDN